jgi:hypothetical protein
MDKTNSEPNISLLDDDSPPQSHIAIRQKRKRIDFVTSCEFLDFQDEMKKLFENWSEKQNKQFEKLFPILTEIKTTNSTIENSMSYLAQQNTELNNKISLLETEIKKKNEYIAIIEERLEETMKTSRKSTVEIKNVPIEPKESIEGLVNMFEKLSKTLNMDIKKCDIRDIYKTKGNTDKKTIIVELNSTIAKANLIKNAKLHNIKNKTDKLCAKHLGIMKHPDVPVFVAESLTPMASRLHFLARDLKKIKTYKYCWTSFGRVYVRKEDNSPIIMIKSESQIQKLMNE